MLQCILVGLSVLVVTVRADCHSSLSKVALRGYTIRSFQSPNIYDCFQKCKQEPSCKSINYYIKGSLCELNNRTIAQKPWHAVRGVDAAYFENPYNRATLGSSASAAATSCQEIKNTSSTAPGGFYWILNDKTNTPARVSCNETSEGESSCSTNTGSQGTGTYDLNLHGQVVKVFCDKKNVTRWTLIARFSNADAKNWMTVDGLWWYDLTTAQGDTINPSANLDMISPAFWSVNGSEIKITRSDDPTHAALLRTTSNCMRSGTFRSKLTSYGNFRNGVVWASNKCLGSCSVVYGGNYTTTYGFSKAACNGNIQKSDKIGFWCDYGGGDGAVMMIGGGGSGCQRAAHGIGVTEEDNAKLGVDQGCDLGIVSHNQNRYALNLWIG